MPIPESQLETWSNRGAVDISANTYNSVKTALEAPTSLVKIRPYLQGSYASYTNTWGDSDVDIVVQSDQTFEYSLDELADNEAQKVLDTISPATYHWNEFRTDVLTSLSAYYGAGNIDPGINCLSIAAGNNRLIADVVACFEYRRYTSVPANGTPQYTSGIAFHTNDLHERQVVNYPKQHLSNGETKNSNSKGFYKPTVRVFKNAKAYLIANELLAKDVAPSYFIQCLLYNVPDEIYGGTQQQNFADVLNWLVNNEARYDQFICQNQQVWLFGPSPEQWSKSKAVTLVHALIELWNSW